jgi:hypothetical protein
MLSPSGLDDNSYGNRFGEESGITPGITRRARNCETDRFSIREALTRGRVHAFVRLVIAFQNNLLNFPDSRTHQ